MKIPLLILIAALAAPGAAQAATVVRVVDGDEVRVRDGKRVRLVKLGGLDAPATDACHGAAAKQALQKLLPKGARVKVQGRYVTRGGKNVNAEMVKGGHARAVGSRLQAAQKTAADAKRGLWSECAPAPTPPPHTTPPPTTTTGNAAIQRARGDIAGRVFINLATTTFSSAESRLHFCSDGSFVEYVETFSDFGGSTYGTYRGRWEVIAAEYREGFAGARVKRLNDDGTVGYLDIVAQGGQVTVNGKVDTVQTSTACA